MRLAILSGEKVSIFYDRMNMHRNRFLVNKTNRCTGWYYYSTCFGQPFCPSSGVLSRCKAERLPETCRVVTQIKLEFSASVGFIHKGFWNVN